MLDEPVRRIVASVGKRPLALLTRLGATPNQITFAGFLLAAVAATVTAAGELRLGIAIWLASRVLDGFDGLHARTSGRATLFGGFLDITLDMLAYSLMAIAFALAMPSDRTLWMIVLVGYVMAITTTLALSSLLERADRGQEGNRSLRFTTAIAEGGETTLVYVLIALLPALSRPVLFVWIVLLAATMLQRGALAHRLLR